MATPREGDPVGPDDLSPAGLKRRMNQEAKERRSLMLLERSREKPANLPVTSIELLQLGDYEEILMGIAQSPASSVEITKITPEGTSSQHFETPEQYVAYLSTPRRWDLAKSLACLGSAASSIGFDIYRTVNHFNEVIHAQAPTVTGPLTINFPPPPTFDLFSNGLTLEQTVGLMVIAGVGTIGGTIISHQHEKYIRILTRFNRLKALHDLETDKSLADS